MAVLLATRFGAASAQARIVVLIAMGIAGLDLLFAVITFFAQFGSGAAFSTGFGYSGVAFAGKTTGVIFGLAQLGFLGIASLYLVTEFLRLPAPAQPARGQWGGSGYAGTGGAQQPWPPAGQGYQQTGQQSWSQQGQPYGGQPYGDQAYGDQGAAAGWRAGEQGQATAWAGQSGDQAAAATGATPQGWGPPAGSAAGWEQPGQGAWEQPPRAGWEEPGQAGWEQPGHGGWGQQPGYPPSVTPPAAHPGFEPAPTWGEAESSETRPGDGDVAGSTVEPDSTEEPAAGSTADQASHREGDDVPRPDDEAPTSDGWWQHPDR